MKPISNSVNEISFASHKFFDANGTELAPTADNLRGCHFISETAGKMVLVEQAPLVPNGITSPEINAVFQKD